MAVYECLHFLNTTIRPPKIETSILLHKKIIKSRFSIRLSGCILLYHINSSVVIDIKNCIIVNVEGYIFFGIIEGRYSYAISVGPQYSSKQSIGS